MRHKVCVVPGLKEMVHEMKGIGRNLNQLTMLANAGTIHEVNLKDMDRRLRSRPWRVGSYGDRQLHQVWFSEPGRA